MQHLLKSPACTAFLWYVSCHFYENWKSMWTYKYLKAKLIHQQSTSEKMFCTMQIENRIPYARLKVQHRMRPQIADLLRLSIYKDLEDHANVEERENIVGVRSNLYFITHKEREDSMRDGKSKVSWFDVWTTKK